MLAAIWTLAVTFGGPPVAFGQPGTNENPDVVRPEKFGAKGDGTTNDRAAVQSAFDAAVKAGGGRVEFNGTRTYHLGDLPTAAAAINCSGLTNVTVEGNGARLTANTTADVRSAMLQFTNASNVRFANLRFRDAGADLTRHWRGASAINLLGNGPGDSGGVVLDNCSGESLLALLMVAGEAANVGNNVGHRVHGISLRDCRVANSYYGVVCQNNGDRLRATGLKCHNIRRAYFVYGVEDHDVDVSISHDGVSLGQDTCCLIKCYDRDTHGIKLRARFSGSTAQYVNGVTLEHQRSAGAGGLIGGIDLGLEVDAPDKMVPVRFRSYQDVAAGKFVEESATKNRWDRIKIGGNLVTAGVESIAFGALVSQGAEGRLFLDPDVTRPQSRQPHYPGFVVCTAHGREVRTAKGNLANQTITIPLKNLETCPFEIIVTTWAQDDINAVAAAKRTVVRDVLHVQNAGAAGVSVKKQAPIVASSIAVPNGPAAAVTYTGKGQDLIVSFAKYSGPNGLARCEVEYISRGP